MSALVFTLFCTSTIHQDNTAIFKIITKKKTQKNKFKGQIFDGGVIIDDNKE